jgi:uncharacterized membrane protein (UPF0127 family)
MDKKFFFQAIGLVIVILGATALTFNPQIIPNLGALNPASRNSTNISMSVIQIIDPATQQVKAQVNTEIADTKDKRSLGLGGRSSLPAESGMLFIMDQRAKPTFWMKGMLIPLDFLWIDGNTVVDMLQNVQPPVSGQADSSLQLYSPITAVDRVLEVNAGYIAAHGIKVGDVIRVVPLASQ